MHSWKATLATLTIALGTTACTTSHHVYVKPKHHVLLDTVDDTGAKVTYTLASGSQGTPGLTRTHKQTYEKANLGVQTRSINRETGGEFDLTPWRGLLVDRVVSSSPAARAGILKGDVLLSLNGKELSTSEQLRELIEEDVEPMGEGTLAILQVGPDGSYPVDPTELQVVFGSKDVDVIKSDSLPMQTHLGIFRLTGLQVGTISAELGNEIYGNSEPVTIVAGSLVGSPAYLAGLRSGDRVTSCGGRPVTSVNDISRQILARAKDDDLDLPADWFDEETYRDLPEMDGDILIEVDGPLGPYSTAIGITEDLYDRSHFYVPIIYSHHSDVKSTSWSFLDFIFQFGANYEGRYRSSNTRAPESDSLISFFPFGMFEFETTRNYDRYCFFWFIEFKDSH